jgi:hypothetical protein
MFKNKTIMLVLLLTATVLGLSFPAYAKGAKQSKPAVSKVTVSSKSPVLSKVGQPDRGELTGAIRTYSQKLWNRILPNWIYPDGTNHVTLTAVVANDGSVESVALSSQPKNTEAESSAQTAFDRIKPLSALPTGLTKARITVVFDSKADPHGDSSSNGSVHIDAADTRSSSPNTDAGTESSGK